MLDTLNHNSSNLNNSWSSVNTLGTQWMKSDEKPTIKMQYLSWKIPQELWINLDKRSNEVFSAREKRK